MRMVVGKISLRSRPANAAVVTLESSNTARCRRRGATAEPSDFDDLQRSGPPPLWRRLPPPRPLPAQPSELAWLSGRLAALQGASRLDAQLRRVQDILSRGSQVSQHPASKVLAPACRRGVDVTVLSVFHMDAAHRMCTLHCHVSM